MIADAIYHSEKPPSIYLRWREKDGTLTEQTVDDFKPHMYIPMSTSNFAISQLKRAYPSAKVCKNKTYEGLDGSLLWRVETNNPFDIYRMSQMFPKTYESDMSFIDQYLINECTAFPKWKPRKWWYDIECNTAEDKFTTVIAVIDSDLDTPVVFAWADERTNCKDIHKGAEYSFTQKKVRDEKYILIYTLARRICMMDSLNFFKNVIPT